MARLAWMTSLTLVAGCVAASSAPGAETETTETESSGARTSGQGGSGEATSADDAGAGTTTESQPVPDAEASTAGTQQPEACDAGPICELGEDRITCPRETRTYRTGATALTEREVHWQVPACPPPPQGYPAVLMFQGSFFTSELNWVGLRDAPLGMWEQVSVLSELLEAGFVVITPEALAEGSTFWETNIPPFSVAWETSADHRLMLALFEGIEAGDFGPVDPSRLFATGISSGGYMTSRMAVSYPGRFRALAIASASYAICGGPACVLPEALPADHPPTLFLHGADDAVVPVGTMTPYADALEAQGVDVRVVIDPDAGHEWIDASVEEVVPWMERELE